jgi:methyltransferase (TIGR00027 family)
LAEKRKEIPDNTAVRVALWRALHVEVDAPPHALEDTIGLKLAAPDEGWRNRGDMHPQGTRLFRASIVARARFIEDLVIDQAKQGVDQYVVLGAGLDTFVQRHPEMATKLRVFEIDQPETQKWKRTRLVELGYGVPDWLRLVPVDFEEGDSWREKLREAGFDGTRPAVVVSTGVSMYLTKQANEATLKEIAEMAPGTIFTMSFIQPFEMADADVRPGLEMSAKGAAANGTPFISYFMPDEMLAMAKKAGFRKAEYISADELARRYFSGRTDGLRPPKNAEELLVATV